MVIVFDIRITVYYSGVFYACFMAAYRTRRTSRIGWSGPEKLCVSSWYVVRLPHYEKIKTHCPLSMKIPCPLSTIIRLSIVNDPWSFSSILIHYYFIDLQVISVFMPHIVPPGSMADAHTIKKPGTSIYFAAMLKKLSCEKMMPVSLVIDQQNVVKGYPKTNAYYSPAVTYEKSSQFFLVKTLMLYSAWIIDGRKSPSQKQRKLSFPALKCFTMQIWHKLYQK